MKKECPVCSQDDISTFADECPACGADLQVFEMLDTIALGQANAEDEKAKMEGKVFLQEKEHEQVLKKKNKQVYFLLLLVLLLPLISLLWRQPQKIKSEAPPQIQVDSVYTSPASLEE